MPEEVMKPLLNSRDLNSPVFPEKIKFHQFGFGIHGTKDCFG